MSVAFEKMKVAANKLRDHVGGSKKMVEDILAQEVDVRALADVPATEHKRLTKVFETKLSELNGASPSINVPGKDIDTAIGRAMRKAFEAAPVPEGERKPQMPAVLGMGFGGEPASAKRGFDRMKAALLTIRDHPLGGRDPAKAIVQDVGKANQISQIAESEWENVTRVAEESIAQLDEALAAWGAEREQVLKDISEAASLIIRSGNTLQVACYEAARTSGWHNDLKTGQLRTTAENGELFPMRIALCHSELSEALEGHRKGLMDDKLPHRLMAEVELADAVIRIFDLAGCMGYELGKAIAEKLAFNAQRADHKIENRKAEGGKQY